MNILEALPSKIIPVVVLEDAANAKKLGECLVANNLPVAEVTMRTDAALDSMRAMTQVEGLVVGAGTVLTLDQAKAAVEAGATFLVSPGLNEEVVKYAQSVGVSIIPGAITPTEVTRAIQLGLKCLKFFPAELSGGVSLLKTFSSVFSDVQFMPTGGISLSNVKDYLSLSNVVACGGSWMVPPKMVSKADFIEIGRLVKEAALLAENA